MSLYIRAQTNTIVNFFVYCSAHTHSKIRNTYHLSQCSFFSTTEENDFLTIFSVVPAGEKMKGYAPVEIWHPRV